MFTSGAEGAATPDRDSLRRCAIFSSLSDSELASMVALLERRAFPAGAVIFQRGDPGDSCYIIESGTAEIVHGGPDSTKVLAELTADAVLGEGCLLTDHPRSATARARTDVAALVLRRCDFDELLESDDLGAYRMVLAMASELHRRLITTNNLLNLLLPAAAGEESAEARRRLLQQWSLY